MRKQLQISLTNTLWLLAPTLLWTLVFQSVVVCIDPLLLHGIERCLPRRVVLLLRTIWAVLFIVAILYVWNITPQTYSFYLHEALPYCSPTLLISLLTAVLLLSWFVASRATERVPPKLSRVLVGVGVVMLVFKLSVIVMFGRDASLQKSIKSQPATVAQWLWKSLFRPPLKSVQETPQNTFNAFVRTQDALPSKAILMVVESWGERPAELQQIVAEMAGDRVQVVRAGFTTYRGATLSGEIRELCSQYLAPSDDLKESPGDFHCAPARFADLGYDVVGLHGFDKAFYARSTFWHRFGIGSALFKEELPGTEQCNGPFNGVCDESLIRRGVEMLDRDDHSRFVYMLTLSSHEPLNPEMLKRAPGHFFRDVKVVHPTQVVTRRAVASLLSELSRRRDQPCVLAYVVGDHLPPSAAAAHDIFVENKVPFVILKYNCPR
jgi:hypothetical protein